MVLGEQALPVEKQFDPHITQQCIPDGIRDYIKLLERTTVEYLCHIGKGVPKQVMKINFKKKRLIH